jgi:hypothetical protein
MTTKVKLAAAEEFQERAALLTDKIVQTVIDSIADEVTKGDGEVFAALVGAFSYFAGKHDAEYRKLIVQRLKDTIETNIEMFAHRSPPQ